MKLAVAIATYERPEMLTALLSDIERDIGTHSLMLTVVNDGSAANYSEPIAIIGNMGGKYILKRHGGKRGFSETVTMAYQSFFAHSYDYFYYFADDFRLAPDYFNRSIEYWKMIDDPQLMAMNTMNTGRVNPGWTRTEPVDVEFSGVTFTRTQWADVHLMADRKFLRLIGYSLPFMGNWRFGSSGVGAYISKTIHRAGHTIYACPNLIGHGEHESMMHPEERKINPLVSTI